MKSVFLSLLSARSFYKKNVVVWYYFQTCNLTFSFFLLSFFQLFQFSFFKTVGLKSWFLGSWLVILNVPRYQKCYCIFGDFFTVFDQFKQTVICSSTLRSSNEQCQWTKFVRYFCNFISASTLFSSLGALFLVHFGTHFALAVIYRQSYYFGIFSCLIFQNRPFFFQFGWQKLILNWFHEFVNHP